MITQEVLGGMVLGLACALAGGLVVFIVMLYRMELPSDDSDYGYGIIPDEPDPIGVFPAVKPFRDSTTRT